MKAGDLTPWGYPYIPLWTAEDYERADREYKESLSKPSEKDLLERDIRHASMDIPYYIHLYVETKDPRYLTEIKRRAWICAHSALKILGSQE